MTIYQLQDEYQCDGVTWTQHERYGLAPNTVQYDLNGDAADHITINYNPKNGEITGVHYTISEPGSSMHLYYYKDTNKYHLDRNGFRGVSFNAVDDAKYDLGTFCRVSQYATNAPNGRYNFQTNEYMKS